MDIKTLLPIVIQVSLILIVASLGLQSRFQDLTYAFKRPGLLLRGFTAVYLVVPAVAILLVTLFPLEPIVKIGIVAMAVSPLAPFAPGKMLKAGADTEFVIGAYIALLLLAVVMVPATLALLALLFPRDAAIGAGPIAWFIFTSVLLPLGAGMLIAHLAPRAAPRLSKIASLIANVTLLLILLPILFMGRHLLAGLIGNGAIVVITLTTLAALAAGHLLGGPDPHKRVALAQAAATRHPGIAGLIVHGNFNDQRAMIAVVLYLLVSIVVSALYNKWARKRLAPAPDRSAPGMAA